MPKETPKRRLRTGPNIGEGYITVAITTSFYKDKDTTKMTQSFKIYILTEKINRFCICFLYVVTPLLSQYGRYRL